MKEMDRFTFEFAELKGRSYYPAFGKITRDFLHSFRKNEHYELILSAFLQRLFAVPEHIDQENYKQLENALIGRVNDILAEERARDKERLAKGRKPVYELQEEEEDYDDEEEEVVLTEEEQQRLEAERLERERREEERLAAREEERRRNEELLRSRARQVDADALAKVLEGAVLLNSGQARQKNGGKQHQQPAATMEDMREMTLQVAHLMKEKERLQTVLRIGEGEMPAMLEEARKELEAAELRLKDRSDAGGGAAKQAPLQPKQLAARIAELKQKHSKLSADRNRLLLQLKAQPHPLHEEILSVMQRRDETLLKLENA